MTKKQYDNGTNFVCPKCGGLWARLYECREGVCCKKCLDNQERWKDPSELENVLPKE